MRVCCGRMLRRRDVVQTTGSVNASPPVSGARSKTRIRLTAAGSGRLRPCSQFRGVRTSRPSRSAYSRCDSPRRARISAMLTLFPDAASLSIASCACFNAKPAAKSRRATRMPRSSAPIRCGTTRTDASEVKGGRETSPDRPQTCEARLQFGADRHRVGPLRSGWVGAMRVSDGTCSAWKFDS